MTHASLEADARQRGWTRVTVETDACLTYKTLVTLKMMHASHLVCSFREADARLKLETCDAIMTDATAPTGVCTAEARRSSVCGDGPRESARQWCAARGGSNERCLDTRRDQEQKKLPMGICPRLFGKPHKQGARQWEPGQGDGTYACHSWPPLRRTFFPRCRRTPHKLLTLLSLLAFSWVHCP